jgi:hypothetical protein
MKKLFISFFLFFVIQKGISQPWAPLGSNEQTTSPIARTAASSFFTQVSSDGVPYISYIDDAGGDNNLGDFKVHARRFNNGQWEFAGDAISPPFPGSDNFPVALDAKVPYVAYSESFIPVDIQNKLTVKRLSTTGKWDVVGQQGLSDSTATGTAIAADNGKIYVAYQDGAFDSKITVRSFDNSSPANGWQTVGTPGFSNGFVLGINIAIDNGIPYVAYLDFGNNLPSVKKFNGTLWEDVGTNNPSGGKQVVINSLQFDSRHTPYITFVDNTGAGIVRNLNAANAWVTTGNQALATGIENTIISLAILHDIPFVAFGVKENGIAQVHVKSFNAAHNNWTDVGNQPLTASASPVNNVILTTDGNNKLLVVFRNLNGEIYAKTFDVGGVLPVSLTSFYVTRQNNKSLLQWVTAGEQDNKSFEVEYSTDAATFKKIGEVTAKVPANIQRHYSFVHSSPARGINYYRLKQVDKNGNYAYAKIISITFNQEQHSAVTLFPNPAKDVLHVGNLTGGGKEILIRNIEGEIIKRLKTTAESIDINVGDLPTGNYFIHVCGDTIIDTKAFIK